MNARCFCGSGFVRRARWMASATVALVVALLAAAGPVSAATVFSDGFESGDYSAWSQVQTGGNGMAVVQSAITRSGGLAAELSESSTAGSRAYARKTFASAQQDLTAGGDFRVIGQGASGGNVPLLRMLDASSARIISLHRQNGTSGTIGLTYGASHVSTSGNIPLNTWANIALHVAGSTVEVTLNGTLIYRTTSASLGTAGVSTVQIGNDTAAQAFNIAVDTINVTSVGGSTPSPPVSTSPPTVSGPPQNGQTLTASPGTWTGAQPITFAYQWQRCSSSGSACAAISGATSSSYAIPSPDVGATLRVVVTATNSVGSSNANSTPTTVVQATSSAPLNTAPPTISGTAREGQTLSAGAGGWTGTQPITFTYQWQRCDSSGSACSPAATGSTYLLTNADVGRALRVVVTATNSAGASTATTNPTAVVLSSSTGTALAAMWAMDETSGLVMKDSVNGHDGALHSVQLGLAGFAGLAYGFNGSGYVSVPSAADLNPGSANMTVTIHLNTSGTPPPPPADWDVIRKGLYSTAGGEFKMEFQQSGQASCGFKGSANYSELIAGPALNNGQWHTIQCVKTGSAIKLIVDGQTFTKAASLGSMANSDPVVIGARPGSDWYRGALDEASIQVG